MPSIIAEQMATAILAGKATLDGVPKELQNDVKIAIAYITKSRTKI